MFLKVGALKARNNKKNKCYYFAPSALGNFAELYLGRWPRLLHFAPLALSYGRRFISMKAASTVSDEIRDSNNSSSSLVIYC